MELFKCYIGSLSLFFFDSRIFGVRIIEICERNIAFLPDFGKIASEIQQCAQRFQHCGDKIIFLLHKYLFQKSFTHSSQKLEKLRLHSASELIIQQCAQGF